MKLYVYNKNSQKVYIKKNALTKRELKDMIGSNHFSINRNRYIINDVQAEVDGESTTPSMLIGGAIGLLGGIPGVIIGSIAGGLLGKNTDEKENQLVDNFNKSNFYE